ncbi:4794_t:CDS:2, partial [Cetraspora pellucida]
MVESIILVTGDIQLLASAKVLISDFGECEILDQLSERDRTSASATGALEIMAPELLTGRYFLKNTQKSDMWSLGMVLYYLCYSRLPYYQIEDVDMLKQEIIHFNSVSFPDNGMTSNRRISSQLRNLITCLLSRNAKRSTPILDNDIRTSNSSHESCSHLEHEKLSRIPSNTSTVTTNPKLRRRKINVEATDKISITPNIINTTVEPDFVVEQNGPFHENSTAAIHLSSSPILISRLPYIIYSYIFEDISWWKLLKLVIMVLKVITCLTPCSPYLPSPW